jgi:hypothetical protein
MWTLILLITRYRKNSDTFGDQKFVLNENSFLLMLEVPIIILKTVNAEMCTEVWNTIRMFRTERITEKCKRNRSKLPWSNTKLFKNILFLVLFVQILYMCCTSSGSYDTLPQCRTITGAKSQEEKISGNKSKSHCEKPRKSFFVITVWTKCGGCKMFMA